MRLDSGGFGFGIGMIFAGRIAADEVHEGTDANSSTAKDDDHIGLLKRGECQRAEQTLVCVPRVVV